MRAGGLTHLLARPWIDPLCLKGMEWILPASRCWAAAGCGDPAVFSRDLGLGHIPAGIAHRVRQTGALRARAGEAQESWIAAAFGGTGNLTVAEHARREAAHIYLSQRFAYLWFARWRNVPAVKLDVPCLSVFSSHDNVVHPKESASLARRGGRDVEVEGPAHLAILFSPKVAEHVASFLTDPDPV